MRSFCRDVPDDKRLLFLVDCREPDVTITDASVIGNDRPDFLEDPFKKDLCVALLVGCKLDKTGEFCVERLHGCCPHEDVAHVHA